MPQNFLIDFTPEPDSGGSTGQTPVYFNRLVSGNTIANSSDGIKMLTAGTVSLTGIPADLDEIFISSTNNPVTVLSTNGYTINGTMTYNLPAESNVLFKVSGTEWIPTLFSSTGTSSSGNAEFMVYSQVT